MITRPTSASGWLDNYIHKVPDESLIDGFKRQTQETLTLLSSLSDPQLDFRYAEGKWNVRELLLHLIDSERVFVYRAMRFARNDNTPLPGFDENEYVKYCEANARTGKSLIEEYIIVRTATVAMFSNFTEAMLDRVGKANQVEMSVRALGFGILGHEIHHLSIIRERYLKQS